VFDSNFTDELDCRPSGSRVFGTFDILLEKLGDSLAPICQAPGSVRDTTHVHEETSRVLGRALECVVVAVHTAEPRSETGLPLKVVDKAAQCQYVSPMRVKCRP
jgi:hypothetical protein